MPKMMNEGSFVNVLLCSKPNRLESPSQSVMKSSLLSSQSTPVQLFLTEENYAVQSMSLI
jgi:hypothetical protein